MAFPKGVQLLLCPITGQRQQSKVFFQLLAIKCLYGLLYWSLQPSCYSCLPLFRRFIQQYIAPSVVCYRYFSNLRYESVYPTCSNILWHFVRLIQPSIASCVLCYIYIFLRLILYLLFIQRVIAAYGFLYGFLSRLQLLVLSAMEISLAYPMGLLSQYALARLSEV